MFKTLIIMMLLNSSVLTSVTHPVFMALIIITQTLILSILTRSMTSSSWIPMTVFLIMVGGLMVIFMYTTSITSNKVFVKMNYKYYMMLMVYFPISLEMKNTYFKESLSLTDNFNKEFFKMFSEINYSSSVFMFLYLLMALMMMIKLMAFNKGPMRKKY